MWRPRSYSQELARNRPRGTAWAKSSVRRDALRDGGKVCAREGREVAVVLLDDGFCLPLLLLVVVAVPGPGTAMACLRRRVTVL
jgi:hypothetical protein